MPAASVRDLVAAATDRLAAAGLATPRVDAELLAEHVFGVPRSRLPVAGDVTEDQAAAYGAAVDRRCAREPVQHITSVAPFRRLELAVGPGVFVPRPETEPLVDWVLDALSGTAHPLVVDLCAGSGAVALAVATEHPDAEVHAVEVDAAAYRFLRHNVARSGADVRTHLADARRWLPGFAGTVHAVTANPPYVPTGSVVDAEVASDPDIACYAGQDGLDGVRTVATAAASLLRPAGVLACEHDAGHGESAPAVLRGLGGWTDVRDHRDLVGRPRFVTATKGRQAMSQKAADR